MSGLDFADQKVNRKVVKLLKEMFMGPWTSWKDVDDDSRGLLFQRFQSDYTWDDSINGLVRTARDAVLKRRWSDIMHDAREESVKKARAEGVVFRESNYEDLIPFSPFWIHQDYWHDMITKVKAQGREPTAMEMFQLTHKTKGYGEGDSSGSGTGQFVTPRAEKFADNYQHEIIEKYGSDTSTHPLGDVEVWERCAGGKKKGSDVWRRYMRGSKLRANWFVKRAWHRYICRFQFKRDARNEGKTS